MLETKKHRSRDPERTRDRLLQAGYREIYRSGFQSASIDAILAATNVTTLLTNWTVLGTPTEGPVGHYQFTDPQPATKVSRYYDVRSP